MVGILLSYWGGLFSGATLVSGRVGGGDFEEATTFYEASCEVQNGRKGLTLRGVCQRCQETTQWIFQVPVKGCKGW